MAVYMTKVFLSEQIIFIGFFLFRIRFMFKLILVLVSFLYLMILINDKRKRATFYLLFQSKTV